VCREVLFVDGKNETDILTWKVDSGSAVRQGMRSHDACLSYDETVAKMGNGFRTVARRDQLQERPACLCWATRDGSSGIAIPVFELDLYLDASGSWKSTPAS
jgi:hypothetical protein